MPDRVIPWPLPLVNRLASLNALAFHVAPALLRPHIASSALPEARLSCIVQRRGVLHFEQLHKMGSVVVPWFLACELHSLQNWWRWAEMGPSSTLVQGCYENWARVAVDVCVAHGERASAARPRQRFRYTRAFSVGSLGSLVSKPLQLRVLHQISLLAGQTWTQEEMEPASVLALMVVLALTQKQGYPLSLVQAPASHLQPPVQGEWPPYATCKTFSVSVDKKRTKTDTGSTKIYSFKNGSRKILPHSATAFIHASL